MSLLAPLNIKSEHFCAVGNQRDKKTCLWGSSQIDLDQVVALCQCCILQCCSLYCQRQHRLSCWLS